MPLLRRYRPAILLAALVLFSALAYWALQPPTSQAALSNVEPPDVSAPVSAPAVHAVQPADSVQSTGPAQPAQIVQSSQSSQSSEAAQPEQAARPEQAVQAAQPTAVVARAYRVAIQVGHWKNDEMPTELGRLVGSTGTYGGGRSEVSLNLDISNRVARLLRAQGIIVDVLPATVPTGYTADAFIAIHADGNASSAPRGFKISTRWSSQVALQDARLVELITGAYSDATGLPEDRNVTRNMRGYYAYATFRPNYRISNLTPGAIVEMGYMSNPADRAVMFNAPDKVASGIAAGMVNFLKEAYGNSPGAKSYGYGKVDSHIDPNAPWETRRPSPGIGTRPLSSAGTPVTGSWDLLMMGSTATVPVYTTPGGSVVAARLPRDKVYHAGVRKGDYYKLDLPGGGTGWVSRNSVIGLIQ